MLKSIIWKEDALLSVKVDENTYILAQMRKNYLMEFFDVFRDDENWADIDLNKAKIIFCLFVSTKNIKRIFTKYVDDDSVLKNSRPIINVMLSYVWVSENNYSADLIRLSDEFSNIGGEVLQSRLSSEKDLELIYKYELSGMYGDPEKIVKRLKIYQDTGINWDESKSSIFPNAPRALRTNS